MVRRIVVALAFVLASVFLFVAAVYQPFSGAIPSNGPQSDPKNLATHVQKLSVEFHPRNSHSLENLKRAEQYIASVFRLSGAQVSAQEVRVDGKAYANVIARFGPTTGSVLVIGAHYDSHDETPGADDNASGVAGLLELARLFSIAPPKVPVELVAFTLEEPPHFRTENMGSVWHARALKREGRPVHLMLSLEMIGFYKSAAGSQHYPIPGMSMLYPKEGNFLALVGQFSDFATMRKVKALAAGATDLPVMSINAPPLIQGIDFSDHRSYWAVGIPAIMVTDTAFFRNPNYHEPGDTHETLDYERMAKAVNAVYAIATGQP